jgi:hypothetical protein
MSKTVTLYTYYSHANSAPGEDALIASLSRQPRDMNGEDNAFSSLLFICSHYCRMCRHGMHPNCALALRERVRHACRRLHAMICSLLFLICCLCL